MLQHMFKLDRTHKDFRNPNFGHITQEKLYEIVEQAKARKDDYDLAFVAVAWESDYGYPQCSLMPVLVPITPFYVTNAELTEEFRLWNPELFIGGAQHVTCKWDLMFLDTIVNPKWYEAVLIRD
ncbi:MAG: hypothetical protein LUE20_08990 [Oscillospiraceae bacterium]|nr:hypothetical protein [Oscillospiraceae bacterium]